MSGTKQLRDAGVPPSFRWNYERIQCFSRLKPLDSSGVAAWIAEQLDPQLIDRVYGAMLSDLAWLCEVRSDEGGILEPTDDEYERVRSQAASLAAKGSPKLFTEQGELLHRCFDILDEIPREGELALKHVAARLKEMGYTKWTARAIAHYTRRMRDIGLLGPGPKLSLSREGAVLASRRPGAAHGNFGPSGPSQGESSGTT